ncbi:GNAT family N-acetyltransferase [Aquirufa aurantiipilula]
MVKICLAENINDVNQAFDLAFRVFNTAVSNEDYAQCKKGLWFEDPSFSIENFILAKDNSKVIGVIRLVPRDFILNKQKISVLGISSVCIDNDYRGKGISNELMLFSDKIAIERGVNLLLLFARRAVDHYYNKFNYFGVSNYSKIKISLKESSNSLLSISFSDYNQELLSIYSAAFDFSYENYYLKALRNVKFWKFIFSVLKSRKDLFFQTIYLNSIPIGYLLFSKTSILEYALLDGYNQKDIIVSIFNKYFSESNNSLEIEINSSHKLNNYLFDFDFTRSIRHCSFGGHMLKICPQKLSLDSEIKDKYQLDFEKTVNYLGSYSDFANQIDLSKSIDIPFFDQF